MLRAAERSGGIPEESRCLHIGIASLAYKNGESSSCPNSDPGVFDSSRRRLALTMTGVMNGHLERSAAESKDLFVSSVCPVFTSKRQGKETEEDDFPSSSSPTRVGDDL